MEERIRDPLGRNGKNKDNGFQGEAAEAFGIWRKG